MNTDPWLHVSDRVRSALDAHRPVVALETTLVTHGLPQPDGMAVAHDMETAVRSHGAEPATIGVLDGRIRVGLDPPELERLAAGPGAVKLNLGNLAVHLARGARGSTTVAATLFAAHKSGIPVFATGGIGGVHRGAPDTGDVSADLTALSRFPVAVVCAGAKAVLDLPRTVEMLETLGVPTMGFGTDEFPAFYRRSSGLRVDARFDDIASLAGAVDAHLTLRTGTGVIVANPIPADRELAADVYDQAIAAALADAGRAGLRGRDVTPYLLDRLRDLTDGASVTVNRALLVNNARVAARLAASLSTTFGREPA